MVSKKRKHQTKTSNRSRISRKKTKKSAGPIKKKSKQILEKHKSIKWFVVFKGLVFFLLVIMAGGVCLLGWNNTIIKTTAKVIPFPVATVGFLHWVSANEYNERVEIIRRYHSLQGVISEVEDYDLGSIIGQQYLAVAKKNLLDRMIKEEVIKIIAKENNISISQEDLQIEIAKIADANGGKEKLAEEVKRIYRISFKDFSEKIIENKIYQRKLYQLVFQRGELNRQGKEITLGEWIMEQTQKFKIYIPLRQYFWHTENARVYFSNEGMNLYEKLVVKEGY
ncbi:MAG: hypothetical protein U9Q72_00010 [Patescibacteria group bacterium]|nr:hypothetical protein [Patescibacteria group bacterium]